MKINTQSQEKTLILSVLAKNMMSFGTKLKSWRKAKGLTQDELAVASGVNVSYISNLERDYSATKKSGKPKASEQLAERFSKVLGVDIDEMLLAAGHAPRNVANIETTALDENVRVQLLGAKHFTEEDKREYLNAFQVAYEVAKRRIAERKNQIA